MGAWACADGTAVAPTSATLQTAAPAIWMSARRHPYDRARVDEGCGSAANMNDISGYPSASNAISLAGVNLALGRGAARVHILRQIDLNIGRGEAVGLLGPSGSGKSTLLMVMTGLERPDAGSVVVAGQELQQLDEDALARFRGRHIGIVFQAFHLIPTMTALENVAVPLQFAGGEEQRVARARALAPDPALIVADEPTGNLDEATGREIIELLFRGHREHGTTPVLVTHDTELAARCDRVVHLHSGRLEAPSSH